MALQTERCPGGYHQESYSAHQGPNGYYSTFQEITEENTNPYSTFKPHVSEYQHHGLPAGGDYHANRYSGGGFIAPVKPTPIGYESAYYKNSYSHGNSYGHGDSHSYGKHFEKPKHGHDSHGSGGSKYSHTTTGINHGYYKPSWTLKSLDDEE